jgi:hypothetical protein
MAGLTESDLRYMMDDIRDGDLSPEGIRFRLGAFMLISGVMVGFAYVIANSSSSVIGWENLSVFWQTKLNEQILLVDE